MKKLMLVLFITFGMHAQDNAIYKPNSEIVNAEASVVVPMGNLSNKFNYAQSYGFWFKLGEDHSVAANLGFNLIFLKEARPIHYTFKDSIYTINSKKFGIDIGARALKIIPISKSKKHYLELGFTLGINYLLYDYPRDETEKEKEKEAEDPLKNTTFLLSPEIRYIHKNVGLKLQYKYTPYGIIKDFESQFGSSSIAFGIVYKQ
jgi:hypothetical protein